MSDESETGGVSIIIGRVWPVKDGPEIDVHILLVAPDDDSAVRAALNALAERGYEEAEFDQIGAIIDAPDEEPHASAYQGALEGEVAIVTFAEGLETEDDTGFDASDEGEDYDPFAVLKDWKPGS
ncbi:transcriptional regulator [Oricola sp.]|uniref:transcriptional regulator n=1 Tax=Oricola sp. TaxID=1979950 RepID=UPI00320481FC